MQVLINVRLLMIISMIGIKVGSLQAAADDEIPIARDGTDCLIYFSRRFKELHFSESLQNHQKRANNCCRLIPKNIVASMLQLPPEESFRELVTLFGQDYIKAFNDRQRIEPVSNISKEKHIQSLKQWIADYVVAGWSQNLRELFFLRDLYHKHEPKPDIERFVCSEEADHNALHQALIEQLANPDITLFIFNDERDPELESEYAAFVPPLTQDVCLRIMCDQVDKVFGDVEL